MVSGGNASSLPLVGGASEPTIRELSRPGRRASKYPKLDVPEVDFNHPAMKNEKAPLPEVSEHDLVMHYSRLAHRNFAVDLGFYPLGSCTMKYNPRFADYVASLGAYSNTHPATPSEFTQGTLEILNILESYLTEITGMDVASFQPPAGASGELTGLLIIKKYLENQNLSNKTEIIVPDSAHGTNPASAVMAGYKVVVVKALDNGYIDIADLKEKAQAHAANLAGIMITYPSTYGVYEETVIEITDLIHQYGGQVYMDGANMNAQVGLTAPGLIGADVCHLNLHKTFAIPHGGGGPGMGPICVKAHLADHLPGHIHTNSTVTAVSAAPYGSASILLISYAYICMLGAEGVTDATKYAILNANYMRARLDKAYDILYTGVSGTCAHEFIVDLRPFKASVGIEAEDIAKRLIDYGFHAPTMSFPVAGTIMIEPTESEDKAELDRFCDALLAIREEIKAIENGSADKANNVLKHAPHTQALVCSSSWDRPYTREQAAFPLAYVSENKFWPFVSRINNTHGDRNLVCTCEPTAAYM